MKPSFNLVLASSSPYRRDLLSKLGLQFESVSPEAPEEQLIQQLLLEKKSPSEIAEALAVEKARLVFEKRKNYHDLIIAGDQLVSFNSTILGKPNSLERAVHQLQQLRGQTHELVTALTLLTEEQLESHVNITRLKMKNLSDQEIQNYVKLDQVADCAGSYKIEKNGLVLFESIECTDFSAIQGIPLIWLSNRLKEYGYEFFHSPIN